MMDITRHKFLIVLVYAVACCVAYAEPVKSMNAAKQQAIMKKASGKVWTWKEMFFNITENTWPEKVVFPPEVANINRSYWLFSG